MSVRFRPENQCVAQDWPALSRYLKSQGLHFEPDPAPLQFTGGLANLNYLILVDQHRAVLRRPPPGPLPPGAYDMARESRILSRLHERFALAPRALHFCADATILGAPFQITEYREGISVRDELPIAWQAVPDLGQELSRRLIEVLATLHRIDPAEVGLGELGRPQGFLARAVEGWCKRASLAFSPTSSRDQSARLAATAQRLAENIPDEGAVTLLHNDFKLDNLLLDPHSREPLALLDWDQGTRGDGLFDLATLLSYWVQADDPADLRAMRQMPTDRSGFWSRRQAMETYALLTGRDLTGFGFHLSLGCFKTAVIFQQLYQRHLGGETQDTRYAGFGAVADALLHRAHDLAYHGIA